MAAQLDPVFPIFPCNEVSPYDYELASGMRAEAM